MLVLSRKRGEQIVVPDLGLAITVVAIEGDRVRLGIAAPEEIAVFREEVWSRIHEDAQRARPDRPTSR